MSTETAKINVDLRTTSEREADENAALGRAQIRERARTSRDCILYTTKSGLWWWRLMTSNGQGIQAKSGQGYTRKDSAMDAARGTWTDASYPVRLVVPTAKGDRYETLSEGR